jgi:hypothetical protein
LPDDKIKEVLIRAAMDLEFRDRLMKDRSAALDGMGLSPSERNLLMASSPEQLTIMIREAQRDPVVKRGGDYRKVAAYCAVLGGGLVLGGVLLSSVVGVSRGISPDSRARLTIDSLALAEQRYFSEFKRFANLQELDAYLTTSGSPLRYRTMGDPYEYLVELAGDKYRIVARHRQEPDKHPGFFLETDGTVQPLK